MEQENVPREEALGEALDALPVETQNFILDKRFTLLVQKICAKFNLSEAATKAIADLVFDTILGTVSEAEATEILQNTGLSEDQQVALTAYLQYYLVNPAANTLEEDLPEDVTNDTQQTTGVAGTSNVSPLQALASIKERLAQKTTVAPVKRDYSIEKAPQTTIVEKRIDPYRELPEA